MKRKGSNLEREYGGSGSRNSEGWDEEDPLARLYGGGEDDLEEDPEDEDEDDDDDEDEDEDEDDSDEEDDDSEDEDGDY